MFEVSTLEITTSQIRAEYFPFREKRTVRREILSLTGEESSEEPIVTKLESAEPEETPGDSADKLVTLIERPQVSLRQVSLRAVLNTCNYCQGLVRDSCYFGQSSSCGYQKLMRFVYPTTCVQVLVQAADTQRSDAQKTVPVEEATPEAVDAGVVGEEDSSPESSSVKSEEATIIPTPVTPSGDDAAPAPATESDSVEKSASSATLDAPQHTVLTSSSESQAEESATVTQDFRDCVERGGTMIAGPPGVCSSCTVAPEVLKISPSATSVVTPDETQKEEGDSSKTDTSIQPSAQEPPGEAKEPVQEAAVKEPLTQEQDVVKDAQEPDKAEKEANGNGMKNIYADEPSAEPGDADPEMANVPISDNLEEPIQKLSPKNKETAFMRLKNRIKELELNLNLSSRCVSSQRVAFCGGGDDFAAVVSFCGVLPFVLVTQVPGRIE